MSNPWQKVRDKVATHAALEGLILFDRGVEALADTEAGDAETDDRITTSPNNRLVFEQRNYPRLSFDSDELRIDTDIDLDVDFVMDEEGEGALDEGLVEGDDVELELEELDVGLIGQAEPGSSEDFELMDMEMAITEDEDSDIWGEFDCELAGSSNNALLDAILPSWNEDNTTAETFDEDDAEADILMGMLVMGMAEEATHMRGPYGQIPTSKDWFSVSMQWKGDRFRKVFRMSPRTFHRISRLLEYNPIFQSSGKKPQRPVAHQFACFLVRYGDSASNGFEPAAKLSLGVGTVYCYCRRVTRALREIGLQCVAWPNDERKRVIKQAMEQICHIPGCIGAGDGTLIRLTHKPRVEGDEYFCYKGYPAVNLFAVVDHEKRFIMHEGGWAGSKSDRTALRNSYLWKYRGVLINRGEQILVDKGFFTSPYTCRPYGRAELNGPREVKRPRNSFNKKLSRGRVGVENAFGMLKKRFPAAGYMGTSVNIQTLHRALEALIALHNLCIDYGDKALARFGDNSQDDTDDEEPEFDLFNFPGHIDLDVELREGGWDGFEPEAWLLSEGNRRREFLRAESHLRIREDK